MASFANSFALLEGSSQESSTTTNKKKKTKKSKKAASTSLPPSDAQQAVPTTMGAPASEEDVIDDDGFQPAGKHSRRGSMGSFNPATPANITKQIGLAEGIADLENAASHTTYRTNADRVKQWRYWQQQVEDKDSENFTDGSNSRSFRDVLLLSQALDITICRCLENPFPTKSDLHSFTCLFVAAKPEFMKHSTLNALLASIVQLTKLLPAQAKNSTDGTTEKAQALLAAAMKLLLDNDIVSRGSSEDSFISDLPDRAASQAQDLDSMGKALSTQSPSASKEYLDQALKALELSKDHMQLFRQERSHMPDESTAGQAVNALDQLLDALAGSQQGALDNNDKPRREDSDAQELANIRSKIRECEQVLEVLRRQAYQLEHQTRSYQTSSVNGYSQHATQEQLDSLHNLRERMVSIQGPQRGPSGWQAQGLSREQLSEAAQYYLTNLERVLHSQLITMREMRPKVEDVEQKLARAIKTGRDLQMIDASKADLAKNQQHQQDHQKKLKEYVAFGRTMMQDSEQQFQDMDWYKVLLHQLWSPEDVQTWVDAFTEVIAECQKALDGILEAARIPSQGQRGVPAVSLSHADPVVQPVSSPAGAIGTSATSDNAQSALRVRLANLDLQGQDQGKSQESAAPDNSLHGIRDDSETQQHARDAASGSSMMNGQHRSSENASEQVKGRRKNRNRRE